MVAYQAQGEPKPSGEAEEKPGASEVTRGFFISSKPLLFHQTALKSRN